MVKPKIAIIIPTIARDELLMETINSILDVWQEDWRVYIIDQNDPENDSEEKKIFYATACSDNHLNDQKQFNAVRVPFNSGISYCRNVGIDLAKRENIPYCLIGADSIKFSKSMQYLNSLCHYIKKSFEFDVDLIGLEIKNRIGWEAKLKMIPNSHFELNFIDKTFNSEYIYTRRIPEDNPLEYNLATWPVFKCDIVRNFFLATTESLYQTKWDFNLVMAEHEDFFYRYRQDGFKVAWTNALEGEYIGEQSKKDNSKYAKIRRTNFNKSKELLFQKYNLTHWVEYKNLERTKNG